MKKAKYLAIALALVLVLAGGCGRGSDELVPGIRALVVGGPSNGSSFADDSSVGSITWSDPSRANISDDSRATASLDMDQVTHYLKATGFGFSIPAEATIDGIQVDVERNAGNTSLVRDNSVRLVKSDGTIGGADKSAAGAWPSSDASITYGNSTDLWGLTWTYSDINSANFGFVISAKHDNTPGVRITSVDHIRITVYYNGNSAPVATPQSGHSADSCSTLTVTLSGTDPDNDPLTCKISTLPAHGDLYDGTGTGGTHITSVPYTVTDTNHKVTYQPNASYSGADSFGFKVNDGKADSAEATISITVSDGRSIWYQDSDNDTYGNATATQQACSQPANYVLDNTDCDDTAASVNPGATEVPYNGKDDDCNPATPDDDLDGDTYGIATDCDDNDANEHPGQTWYKDADNDLYSDGTTDTTSCTRPTGYKVASELTATSGDCNDIVAAVHPGATELCNGIDDDCDTMVDEGVTTTYYRDADLDTYGNPAVTTQACSAPAGYVANNTDCNDSDAKEHPGQTWYKDADNDLYSDGTTNTTSCTRPAGYKVASELTATSGDCNDIVAAVHPGATELCNGIDDDCDTLVDEEGATGCTTYWKDADGDTYGANGDAKCLCAPTGQYTATRGGDSNDNDAGVNPGTTGVSEPILWYILLIYSTEGGSVTAPGEGVFNYYKVTVVDLVATPDAGYRFVKWTPNVGTIADINAASTTITMNSDCAIRANFEEIPEYDLTIASTKGVSAIEPGEGVFTYDGGTVVDLVAEAEEGYRFIEWTGDVGTIADVYAAETTITMNGDYSITANFEEVPPSQVYPTVTTQAATKITTSSTTLEMSYTAGDFSPVKVRFAYKKSTDSTWSYTAWVSKRADGTHAEVLTGLDFNTAYGFKSQLKYDGTVVGGTTLQFTTDTPSPSGSGGCFIATAAYGTPSAKQIDLLREFRDVVLLKSTVGSQFVALYYRVSHPIADFVAGNELLTTLVRELLVDPIVWVVQATEDTQRN